MILKLYSKKGEDLHKLIEKIYAYLGSTQIWMCSKNSEFYIFVWYWCAIESAASILYITKL